jgi:uncharacterized cupredoxin-like copper-binding protein
MAKLGTFFFAEDLRDEGNGRYFAIGLYSGVVEFDSPKNAKLKGAKVFASINELKKGDHYFELKARNHTASEILDMGREEFEIEEDNTNFLLVADIEGMVFPKEGDYSIEISVDGELLGATEFEIKFSAPDDAGE